MSQLHSTKPETNRFFRILAWVVAIVTLVALVLTGVRILLVHAFLPFEYSMPGFPPDPYGFSKTDRLYWSGIAMDYLLNSEGIDFLGNLRFQDGSAVYNDRELSHMVDVKIALQNALKVWMGSLVVLVCLGVWAWRGRWTDEFRRGLRLGGWLSVFFVAGVIVVVLISFGAFFVGFHEVFFQPGTWMFYWSDTLIRLFPERFWRDIFIYIGVITAGLGLLVVFLARTPKQAGGRTGQATKKGINHTS
jgi:integral membrane protein (TIGR01906 family)